MEAAPANKRPRVTDPIMVRVELINGMFDVPQETKDAMNQIREILEEADRKLARVFIRPSTLSHDKPVEQQRVREGTHPSVSEPLPQSYVDVVPHDKGRVIAGFDLIQQAKNVMIDGLLFKLATAKEIKDKEDV